MVVASWGAMVDAIVGCCQCYGLCCVYVNELVTVGTSALLLMMWFACKDNLLISCLGCELNKNKA